MSEVIDCSVDGSRVLIEDENRCACTNNLACNPEEHCNARGYCQLDYGDELDDDTCATSDGCGDDRFCFLPTATCIANDLCEDAGCCATDASCPFGMVCDALRARCVDGCADGADCLPQLQQECHQNEAELGVCHTPCGVSGCNFGEHCGSTLVTDACVPDANVCRPCIEGVAGQCGAPANQCLSGGFCGTDCLNGQSCPFGFVCVDVLVGACDDEDDCTSGTCEGEDLTDPGAPIVGACTISGNACFEDFECAVVACVDGACRIGRNCAPDGGESCDALNRGAP